MKKRKNNLDEMQEKKLLQVEHNGFWLAFWGLFASIYLQIAMGNVGIKAIGGEAAVMIVIGVYLMVGCIRHGIWDRSLKPNWKTNLMISLTASLCLGLFWGIKSYYTYHALAGSVAAFLFVFVSASAATMALLTLLAAVYKQRKQKIEQQADQEEKEA